MKFPRLFVTDLDGTALGGEFQPYARFPDPFAAFLDRLDQRGCRWAICTTWDVQGQWQLILASGVRSRPSFLIGEISQRIAEPATSGLNLLQPYTADAEAAVARVSRATMLPMIRDICSRFSPQGMHFYGHWFDFTPTDSDREACLAYVRERYAHTPGIEVNCTERLFRVYPSLLNKGTGVTEIIRRLGLGPDDVVVAGDNIMDLSMMQPSVARHVICPESASPEVKAHVVESGGVVGTGTAGLGVIDAFQRLARQRWPQAS